MYRRKKIVRNGALLLKAKRRILLGWVAFEKVYSIMRSTKSIIETKRNLFNEYILLVMTYGNEKWVLNTLLQRL